MKKFVLIIFLFSYHCSKAQFVTNWITTDNTITIPTTGTGYNYNITWTNLTNAGVGNGSIAGRTGNHTITGLANNDTYQIEITGAFPRIYFYNGTEKLKIRSITQWGNIAWASMSSAFFGCSNLGYTATDAPNLTAVADMSYMFRGCSIFNGNISNWNTTSVTNMSGIFFEALAFNQPIGTWNTAAVTNMAYMFLNAYVFNQPIGTWNTANVTSMVGMFSGANVFNQPIGTWNTANVTSMSEMFYNANAFNQPVGNWNTTNVTSMLRMFTGTYSFNYPLANWNTAKVTNMAAMFFNNFAFNQPLNTWNTSLVMDMTGMFIGARNFNQPLGTWNTAKVTNMGSMFSGATAFNQPIGTWNTAAVTNMGYMFENATAFNQPIDTWNTGAVTNMSRLLSGCTVFNQPIGSWNTSVVTNMSELFSGCTVFNQPIGSWNTTNVTSMHRMFNWALAFNQPIGNWNTTNVKDMSLMFIVATSFNQPIANWNTSAVTNMSSMFYNANAFNQPIGNWNTSAVTNMSGMFRYNIGFSQPIGTWNTSAVTNMGYMFESATAFNQSLAPWATQLNVNVNLTDMLNNSGLSVANYDATLIAFNASAPIGRNLGAVGRQYCDAIAARANLIAAKGWTITGDSRAPGTLATAYQTVTQDVTLNSFIVSPGCIKITNVLPNGALPIAGSTTAKVWIDATQNIQFVKRHYEITPAANAATATGRVTLYFTQAEFDAFNAINTFKLPAHSTDASGKSNLLIEKRSGTSSNGSGHFNTYGAATNINPADADIIWNATLSQWEVSFDVTGFSGFWVKTKTSLLPLNLLSFTGTKTSNGNLLAWKTANEINTKYFEIERSFAASNAQWQVVGGQNAMGSGDNNYTYTDKMDGDVLYRLKMIDADGKFTYSSIIKISNKASGQLSIYPNPIIDNATLQISNSKLIGTNARIVDVNGRTILTFKINNHFVPLHLAPLSSGIYLLRFENGEVMKLQKK